ncbi:hypothetical protein F5X99DRAFT_380937 [Biscogniauxia marginata]|nr:hypothetical protein F5X99DRAFT_380937 [Biscogniauxia marginata]
MKTENESWEALPRREYHSHASHQETKSGPQTIHNCLPHTSRNVERSADESLERIGLVDSSGESGNSQTPVCDDAFVTVERYIHERRNEIINNVIRKITHLLHSKLILTHKKAAEEASTSPSIDGSSGQHLSSDDRSIPRKRKSGQRGHGHSEEEDGKDSDPQPNNIRNSKGKTVGLPRFACPYLKYNPIKYKDWQNCPGPGWRDVHRVKEHLYRRHRQPRHICGRCWEPFDDEQSYIDHQRTTEPCSLREKEPIEGFDSSQEAKLRSRKKMMTVKSEDEKWQQVFRILFPHVSEEDIPSPFYDFDQLSNPAAQTHDTLTECEMYVCREVPLRLRQLLRPEIDRDLHIVEQSLARRVVESMPKLLDELFREFRETRQQRATPIVAPEHPDEHNDAVSRISQAKPPKLLDSNSLLSQQEDLAYCDFDFNFNPLDPTMLANLQASLSEDIQISDLL